MSDKLDRINNLIDIQERIEEVEGTISHYQSLLDKPPLASERLFYDSSEIQARIGANKCLLITWQHQFNDMCDKLKYGIEPTHKDSLKDVDGLQQTAAAIDNIKIGRV